ncbi:V-type ATP synthase subunit F [Demequina sp.]|uniref:V-type ATP synthase subunit F n=1 Tax=Demequina sp. TaxID=2050685 RepID=UPI0025D28C20|nr:V-type ATP synthase subunit F [Demequina sp.]
MNDPAGRAQGVVVALGERRYVGAFALAGARVAAAEDPAAMRTAWESLERGVGLVVLSETAAAALGDLIDDAGAPLTVVLPS